MHLFQTLVDYLGHIASNGVEPDTAKIKALKSWPVPKQPKKLKYFEFASVITVDLCRATPVL